METDNLCAFRQIDIGNLGRPGGRPKKRLDGPFPTQLLIERPLQQRAVGAQPLPLFGMEAEGMEQIADTIDGRIDAGRKECSYQQLPIAFGKAGFSGEMMYIASPTTRRKVLKPTGLSNPLQRLFQPSLAFAQNIILRAEAVEDRCCVLQQFLLSALWKAQSLRKNPQGKCFRQFSRRVERTARDQAANDSMRRYAPFFRYGAETRQGNTLLRACLESHA
jgi:hypothetical protein